MSHDNSENGRVLITNGRSVMALTAAHSLHEQGIEVIGCDEFDWTILSFSRYTSDYFVHPSLDDEQKFVDAMYAKVLKHKPNDDRPYQLMPIHRLTPVFARHRETFEPEITITAPPWEAMSAVQPKDRFAETAQKFGVNIPETHTFSSIEELQRFADWTDFPRLIKPVDATGGRGISKVESASELKEKAQAIFDEYGDVPLVQELAEGEDYCFAGIFDQGELRAAMAYTNVYNFPADSGAGVFRETVDETPFVDEVKKLMKALKWHGVAEVDFMWDGNPDHRPVMIEVNARFWGGLFQSVESGIDFPALLFELFSTGAIKERPAPIIGTQTKIPFLWLTTALKDFNWDNDAVRDAVQSAREKSSNKSWLAGLRELSGRMSRSMGVAANLKQLRELLHEGDGAINEPFYEDDPKAVLGVAFVLNSLLTRGELPPEVKF